MKRKIFIQGVYKMIALEINTDYFIEEQNLKMVKSKYPNLYKKTECGGFSFNYVIKLIIKCT